MKNIHKNKYLTDASVWDNYLKEQLKDPFFKKHYDNYGKQLEIAYQILQLRKKRKLSQLQLAKKIGTKQGNIARIESGQQNLSIDTLEKIAAALNSRVNISFVNRPVT